MNKKRSCASLGALPCPNPRDLSHGGQRQVALAGRENPTEFTIFYRVFIASIAWCFAERAAAALDDMGL
ncbi:MAG: hypothetical protein ACOYKN_20590 [Pirellula sp.]